VLSLARQTCPPAQLKSKLFVARPPMPSLRVAVGYRNGTALVVCGKLHMQSDRYRHTRIFQISLPQKFHPCCLLVSNREREGLESHFRAHTVTAGRGSFRSPELRSYCQAAAAPPCQFSRQVCAVLRLAHTLWNTPTPVTIIACNACFRAARRTSHLQGQRFCNRRL